MAVLRRSAKHIREWTSTGPRPLGSVDYCSDRCAGVQDAVPETYAPGWMPGDGEIGVAPLRVIENSPPIATILGTVERRDRGADPVEPENPDENADGPAASARTPSWSRGRA